MSAVSGTRRAIRELSDGTIRVQVDIDPIHRREFLRLFPDIDAPVALAPLVADFDHQKTGHRDRKLSEYAAFLCEQGDFQYWIGAQTAEGAATAMRRECAVASRAEFDVDEAAAERFHELRRQYHMAAPGQRSKQFDERAGK